MFHPQRQALQLTVISACQRATHTILALDTARPWASEGLRALPYAHTQLIIVGQMECLVCSKLLQMRRAWGLGRWLSFPTSSCHSGTPALASQLCQLFPFWFRLIVFLQFD